MPSHSDHIRLLLKLDGQDLLHFFESRRAAILARQPGPLNAVPADLDELVAHLDPQLVDLWWVLVVANPELMSARQRLARAVRLHGQALARLESTGLAFTTLSQACRDTRVLQALSPTAKLRLACTNTRTEAEQLWELAMIRCLRAEEQCAACIALIAAAHGTFVDAAALALERLIRQLWRDAPNPIVPPPAPLNLSVFPPPLAVAAEASPASSAAADRIGGLPPLQPTPPLSFYLSPRRPRCPPPSSPLS